MPFSDNQVAIELLTEVGHITIRLVCADAGYRGELGDYLTHQFNRSANLGGPGFVVFSGLWSAPFLGSVGFAD